MSGGNSAEFEITVNSDAVVCTARGDYSYTVTDSATAVCGGLALLQQGKFSNNKTPFSLSESPEHEVSVFLCVFDGDGHIIIEAHFFPDEVQVSTKFSLYVNSPCRR